MTQALAVKKENMGSPIKVPTRGSDFLKPKIATQTTPFFPVIQRKPTCACGGGCPKCQAKQQVIQPKLKIGAPNDKYEQEADRVADAVMRMPEPEIQLTPTSPFADGPSCGDEETVQTEQADRQNSEVYPGLEDQIRSATGTGQPLPSIILRFFEPRFGHDFSKVRVHMDTKAAESARAINALAYTAGYDIVFGAGKSPDRDTLTAHELTHVLQQNIGNRSAVDQAPTVPFSLLQRECRGDVGSPTSYASAASNPRLRCDSHNTGIGEEGPAGDAEVTRRITAGRHMARVMIDRTLIVLNRMITDRSGSEEALRHFRRLFGLADPEPTDDQIRTAIEIYTSICTWLTTRPATTGGGILCLQQGTGDCRGPYYGLASCTTGTTTAAPIMLCPDGISDNSYDTAETIIHEAAHGFGICMPPLPPRPGSPPGTPPREQRELYEGEPRFPPRFALQRSADSYSAFAREANDLIVTELLAAQPGGGPTLRLRGSGGSE